MPERLKCRSCGGIGKVEMAMPDDRYAWVSCPECTSRGKSPATLDDLHNVRLEDKRDTSSDQDESANIE